MVLIPPIAPRTDVPLMRILLLLDMGRLPPFMMLLSEKAWRNPEAPHGIEEADGAASAADEADVASSWISGRGGKRSVSSGLRMRAMCEDEGGVIFEFVLLLTMEEPREEA